MGGCRCSYRDCPNTTKTENVHFFHYPVKHKDRCRQWIENAQKPQFCDLEEEQLRNKVICDQHFEEKWFPNIQRKRLLQGAIPTLPGNSIAAALPMRKDKDELPVFLPQKENDIQVLPANSEGTVFLLDTDTMFTKSAKIESYIYLNGSLVPSSLVTSNSGPDASTHMLKSYSPVKLNENKLKRHHSTEPKHFFTPELRTNDVKMETADYCEKTNSPPSSIVQDEPRITLHKKMALESNVRNPIKQEDDDAVLDKTYLEKINQHSRDIASIKQLLKEKVKADKRPDNNTILNILKQQLPPTLHTILTLNLTQECTLTEDDVDFFTTIHRLSPEVYQLLVDKYNWNLPSVDIVDSLD